MAELKPCPFCGRTPTVDDCGDHRYFVQCKCGVAQDKLYMQKCDAVRRWNTRKTGEFAKNTNVPSTDCISRQATIDADSGDKLLFADRALKALPSAQPEQQIRCNECIYFDKYTDGIEKYQWDGFCSVWARNANEEWYCSRAERRTE